MNSEGKIGIFEATCFTSLVMVNKIFFTSVGGIVYQTGTAAWYTTLLSCLVTLVFFIFIYLLLKRFPDKDIVRIYETVLGKLLGSIFTLFICGFFVFNAGSTLREFVEMIKVYNLPSTPISIIMITFLSVSMIISYFGLQTLGRICALCFIPTLIGLGLILLLAAPSYDTNLLKPYGGYGAAINIEYGFMRSSAYFEFILLGFAINAAGGYKTYKKIGISSIIIAGTVFTISLLCYLMTFGYTVGGENISGIFELSRSIFFNRFLQRVESIFLFIWVISSVISTTASYYFSLLIYSKVFTIKDHKPLLIPFAILVFVVAILPDSMQVVSQFNIVILRQYSMFVIYIPAILVLIAILFKKKGRMKNA
jgi:spore germination protein KB